MIEDVSLRDNLIATLGRRAGNMECIGFIEIDGTSLGEDRFAAFAARTVSEWLALDPDASGTLSFDEFIETALIEKYRIKKGTEQ